MNKRLPSLLLVLILLAYVAIAWQAIRAPFFVLDDMAELAYVRSCSTLAGLWQHDCFLFFRPIKNLLFLGFDALHPFGLPVCRVAVVAIGLISAIAVHALFRHLLRGSAAVLSATACWLLAPTLVTCTAWLSCVNIQAMTAFAAIAILLFWQVCENPGAASSWRLAGAWLASLLAMLCYEGAVCLPALLFLLDYFLRPERLRARQTWQIYAVAGSALLLYLLLRVLRQGASQQFGNPNFGEMADWQLAVAAPYFFWQHVSIWAWPFGRQAISGGYFPGQVSGLALGCAWMGVLALVAACLLGRKRCALAALGLAWCLVAFLPMSNLFAFRNGPYADYYLALASLGPALAFGWLMGALADRGWRTMGVLVAMVLVGGWRLAAAGESFAWARAWNAPEALLQRTLRTFPYAFTAINEYARGCFQAGNLDECLAWTDRATRLAPYDRTPHVLRALIAERRRQLDLAWSEVNQFMQAGGTNESWGWYFQGYLLDEHAADTNGATRCYRNAIANRTGWSPDVLEAMCALAYFAAQRGDLREAITLWEQVVRIDPSRWQIRQNLARAYRETGEAQRKR
ncbi:MAG: tetratricopeptide repeat protein [Kiritimatiellia bacterium]